MKTFSRLKWFQKYSYVDIFNAEKLYYKHMQLFIQTPFLAKKRFVREVILKDGYFDSPVFTF